MFHSEHLQEKWAPLLDYQGLDKIKDSHRRSVTAVLLENQERFLKEQAAFDSGSMGNLMEATPTNAANAAGASGGFTLSTIRAGTAGGNATAGVTGTASQFDQVLVEINNLVTLQEAKKDAKFREFETADSIRKTLMIDF